MNRMNKRAYRSGLSVRTFSETATEGLFPAERKCFELVPAAAQGSVLDIGIGAGRTVRPLLKMFSDYTGIDYSEPLVAAARRAFPTLDLRVMDARNLQFEKKFDCVVFSRNGIDYVPYEDREKIRRSIAEVLRPGGYLIYSTHNLAYHYTRMWLTNILAGLGSPRSRLRFFPRRLINFWRQRRDPRGMFAYVNDASLGFRLLTVYVDIPRELEVLEAEGFRVRAAVGERKERGGFDADDGWVYIVAQVA